MGPQLLRCVGGISGLLFKQARGFLNKQIQKASIKHLKAVDAFPLSLLKLSKSLVSLFAEASRLFVKPLFVTSDSYCFPYFPTLVILACTKTIIFLAAEFCLVSQTRKKRV